VYIFKACCSIINWLKLTPSLSLSCSSLYLLIWFPFSFNKASPSFQTVILCLNFGFLWVNQQGDQIGQFLEISFWKDKVAQINSDILGYFCLIKSITFSPKQVHPKHGFVAGILRFQKFFDVDILVFQFELCYKCFGIFWFIDF